MRLMCRARHPLRQATTMNRSQKWNLFRAVHTEWRTSRIRAAHLGAPPADESARRCHAYDVAAGPPALSGSRGNLHARFRPLLLPRLQCYPHEEPPPMGAGKVHSCLARLTSAVSREPRRLAWSSSHAVERGSSAAAPCSAVPLCREPALVVLRTPRSASLTASAEGKAAATSGSSRTRLLPLRSRATYLPRTPPFIDAKSYSGRRSLSLCRFALFIELSLAPRRSTGADDADGVVSLRVGHNQDVSPRGCTDCQETGLRL